jgi:4-hydroxybenzoate polyprenyltransferase
MLASGVVVAWYLSFLANDARPGAIATLLAVCVVLYDRVLKQTFIGPFVMGACRALNVLLGMSLAYFGKPLADGELLISRPWHWGEWLIAAGIGIYIVGVTVFARTDARTSTRGLLVAGLVILLGGMGVLAAAPALSRFPELIVRQDGWYLLWLLLALITARRCVMAILQPTSERVQVAVKHCVHSLIVLDAAVALGFAGPVWGFAVLALIFPTVLLAGWLRAT